MRTANSAVTASVAWSVRRNPSRLVRDSNTMATGEAPDDDTLVVVTAPGRTGRSIVSGLSSATYSSVPSQVLGGASGRSRPRELVAIDGRQCGRAHGPVERECDFALRELLEPLRHGIVERRAYAEGAEDLGLSESDEDRH